MEMIATVGMGSGETAALGLATSVGVGVGVVVDIAVGVLEKQRYMIAAQSRVRYIHGILICLHRA